MKLKITRIDKTLPLPGYQTKGSVAFDLYSRINCVVQPGKLELIPANLIIQVPKGFMLLLAARSGLSKRGLRMSNGVGIIDQDYHGPKDEIHLFLTNF